MWQSYNENNDSKKKKKMHPKTYRLFHTKFTFVFVSLSFLEKRTSKLRKLRVLSPFWWMQKKDNKVNLVQSCILLSLSCLLVQQIMGLWIWNLKQERVGENEMSIFVNVSVHRLVYICFEICLLLQIWNKVWSTFQPMVVEICWCLCKLLAIFAVILVSNMFYSNYSHFRGFGQSIDNVANFIVFFSGKRGVISG